jgi:hypothetical protein
MWTVNLWDCEPGTDDCCRTGDEFATEAEAREVYERTWPTYFKACVRDVTTLPWLELTGPGDVRETRQNPAYVPREEREDYSDLLGLPECHHLFWYDAVHGSGEY